MPEHSPVTDELGEHALSDTVALELVEPADESLEKEAPNSKLSVEEVDIIAGMTESLVRINGESSTEESRAYGDRVINATMHQVVDRYLNDKETHGSFTLAMLAQGLGAASNLSMRESIAETMIQEKLMDKEDLNVLFGYVQNMHRLSDYTETRTLPFEQLSRTIYHQMDAAIRRSETTGDRRLQLAVTTATLGLTAVSDNPMAALRQREELLAFTK